MLKYIAPIEQRLRHLPRPAMFRGHPVAPRDEMTHGQKVAERIAAVVGGWPFIIYQNVFFVAWVAWNIFAATHAFDKPPFVGLNLILSFLAGETGPILLIAANVAASRDQAQWDRMEKMEKTLLEDNALLRGSVDALRSEIAQLTAQKEPTP